MYAPYNADVIVDTDPILKIDLQSAPRTHEKATINLPLKLMSGHDHPIEWQYQKDVIRDLLNGHLTPKTAAPKLAAVTLQDQIPDADNEYDEDSLIVNIERMFNMMIRPLQTQPEHVQTIFDLIICISKLPPALTVSGRQLCETNPPLPPARVWEDLPRLGRSLGGACEGRSIPPGGAPRTDFIAAHELLGLLMKYDVTCFDFRVEALWTMRYALEHPLPNASDQQQQDRALYHLPAAIKFIETVGHKFHECCQESEEEPEQDPSGPLWNGQLGFCSGRWEFWQKRLLELSGETFVCKEYRESARKAVDVMSDAEQRSRHD